MHDGKQVVVAEVGTCYTHVRLVSPWMNEGKHGCDNGNLKTSTPILVDQKKAEVRDGFRGFGLDYGK